jgi:hypothetical protein
MRRTRTLLIDQVRHPQAYRNWRSRRAGAASNP